MTYPTSDLKEVLARGLLFWFLKIVNYQQCVSVYDKLKVTINTHSDLLTIKGV